MLAETRDSRNWWGLVVVGTVLRIGAESFEARGEVRRISRVSMSLRRKQLEEQMQTQKHS